MYNIHNGKAVLSCAVCKLRRAGFPAIMHVSIYTMEEDNYGAAYRCLSARREDL